MVFKEICKDKGISPSYTRMRIFDYIHENKSHPTVDEIYQTLKPDLPTLSKTTVYNVLNLFIQNDIVSIVNINAQESRYEIMHDKHSHFKCNSCGEIFDIAYVKPQWNTKELEGFTIEEDEVVLKGICKKCSIKRIDA